MNTYVVVNNPSKFDLNVHFSEQDSVIWKYVRGCKIGDTVYIYVGRPEKRIVYKCVVIEVDIAEVSQKKEIYMNTSKYMRLKLENTFPPIGLFLKDLLANGLKTVQCATQASDSLTEYIKEIERNY